MTPPKTPSHGATVGPHPRAKLNGQPQYYRRGSGFKVVLVYNAAASPDEVLAFYSRRLKQVPGMIVQKQGDESLAYELNNRIAGQITIKSTGTGSRYWLVEQQLGVSKSANK